MVFGLKKRTGLNDSFQSVGGGDSDDNDEEGLIRGRQRSEEGEGKVRSRSRSVAARKIASTVAKLTKRVSPEEEDCAEPAVGTASTPPDGREGRRRWRSKTPSKQKEEKEDKESVASDDIYTSSPEIEKPPSTMNFEMEETPLRSPVKTPRRRRWRSVSRDRKVGAEKPASAPNLDGDDDVSENGSVVSAGASVVASVKSMFEVLASPRRNPKKLSAEAPEMSELHSLISGEGKKKVNSPSKSSPSRVWRPRSPVKAKEIHSLPLPLDTNDDDHSEVSLSVNGEEFLSKANGDSSTKRFTPLAAPSMADLGAVASPNRSPGKSPRRKWRSKTPETRSKAQQQHHALGSPPDSPVSADDVGPTGDPLSLAAHTSSPRRSKRSTKTPKVRPSILPPPTQGMLKTGSQSSLTGILRTGSNNSACSASKWTGGLNSSQPNLSKTDDSSLAETDPNDSMSQILEGGESDLEQSLASLQASIARLENESCCELSLGNLEAALSKDEEVPSLVKDIQQWREGRLNGTLTQKLEGTKSHSERGTRSTMDLDASLGDFSVSKTVAGLVSPQKIKDQKHRSNKTRQSDDTALPTVANLNDSDLKARKMSRRREPAVARTRGRSRPKRKETSAAKADKSEGDSRSSRKSRTNSRGGSQGRSSNKKTSDRSKSRRRKSETSRKAAGASPGRGSSRGRDKRYSVNPESPKRKSRTSGVNKLASEQEAPKTPSRRKPVLDVEPTTPSRRTESVSVGNAPLTPKRRAVNQFYSENSNEKAIRDEIKSALDPNAKRQRTPTKPNPRLRSKSVGRKSPKTPSTSEKKVQSLVTPVRNRRRISSDDASNSSLSSIEASAQKLKPRPSREQRRTKGAALAKNISSNTLVSQKSGESFKMKVKIKKKQRKPTGEAPTVTQLHIPAFKESACEKQAEARLKVEYCEAPQVPVS